jgi:hypothetical protein
MKAKILALICFFCPSFTVIADTSSNSGYARVQAYEGADQLGINLLPGRLIYQQVGTKTGRCGEYFYRCDSGEWVRVSGDICAMNRVLGETISSPLSDDFLRMHLARFVVSCMAPPSTVIMDLGFGNHWKGSMPVAYNKYIGKIEPIAQGRSWTVEFNVITEMGTIQAWTVRGNSLPIAIQSLSIEIKEQAGGWSPYKGAF